MIYLYSKGRKWFASGIEWFTPEQNGSHPEQNVSHPEQNGSHPEQNGSHLEQNGSDFKKVCCLVGAEYRARGLRWEGRGAGHRVRVPGKRNFTSN